MRTTDTSRAKSEQSYREQVNILQNTASLTVAVAGMKPACFWNIVYYPMTSSDVPTVLVLPHSEKLRFVIALPVLHDFVQTVFSVRCKHATIDGTS